MKRGLTAGEYLQLCASAVGPFSTYDHLVASPVTDEAGTYWLSLTQWEYFDLRLSGGATIHITLHLTRA